MHRILWSVNYQTLCLMLADAPHCETRRAGDDPATGPRSLGELFQTKLNDMR